MLIFFAFLWCTVVIGGLAEPELYRLSDDVVPRSYDLKIIPDLKTLQFSGKVTIEMTSQFTIKTIKLHSKNLVIKGPIQDTKRTIIGDLTTDEEHDLLIVNLREEWPANTIAKLTFDFEGKMNQNAKGFYVSSYEENGDIKWLAATHLFATYAREVFPCFDEPRFRTPFTISIARAKNQKTLSNMPFETKYNFGETAEWDKFQTSPPMPTHLVAFMICESDYVNAQLSKPNDILRIWIQNSLLESTRFALTHSSKILQELQDFTAISYRLPKLDIVVIPEVKSGEMGNWGMITLTDTFVIADDKRISEHHKTELLSTLTNQLSRQWYGALVTPVSWDCMWLTDALAAYTETEIMNTLNIEEKSGQFLNFKTQQSILWAEVYEQRALTISAKTASQINTKYNKINILKGSAILIMLENIISKYLLKNAIHKYLADGRNLHAGLVNPANFYNALEEQSRPNSLTLPSKVSISDIMRTWVDNIGHPLIKVSRNPSTNEVTFEQITYKSPRAPILPPDQEWIVPISYTTKSKNQFLNTPPSLWSFANKIVRLPEPLQSSQWIICNLQRTGYYRVTYDSNNWNLLIDQLHENHLKIHVLNRAQLIDDSFTLAFDDMIPYSIPLRLGEYLKKETKSIPLISAIIHLNRLYSKYEHTKNRVFFCMYIVRIFEGQYHRLGFHAKPTDGQNSKEARLAVSSLVCKVRLPICIKDALNEYDKNVHDLSQVTPDLKELVYCTAIREAEDPRKIYENLWVTYRDSHIPYDKNTILKSLACAKDVDLLKRFLFKILDPNDKDVVKSYSQNYAIDSILSSSNGVTAILQFFQEQTTFIAEADENTRLFVGTIVKKLTSRVQTETHIRLLHKLHTQYSELANEKFGVFTESFQQLRSLSIHRVRENNKKSDQTTPIFYEILKITPPSPPPPKSGSSTVPVPFSILYLCLSSFVICLSSIPRTVLTYHVL